MTRSGSFGELIYTRCGPGYSIRGEALPGNNGYGIFNMSAGLWEGASDATLQFAERVIARQFQWTYGCPVKRYSSYLLLPGTREGVFADLYRYTDEDLANNSEMSNMRGTHLAQMLSGELTMYPYELIESPYFEARQKVSTDTFYRDDCEPKLGQLPQQDVQPGPVTRDAIQSFLSRGREELAQDCTAWLIEQMEKPEAERRPIIILDDADKIPFWVGAITYCLPVTIARQVPFYTCREGLDRPNRSIFYRVDKATGEYVAKINMQDPNQESRPLAMLLGCAREDADAVRQVELFGENSPCVVLNGVKGSINFKPDEKIAMSNFIRNASKDSLVHNAVLAMMEEIPDLPFSRKCITIYNAMLALTAKMHPSPAELTEGLKALRPYLDAKHRCIRMALNSLIEQRDYCELYLKKDAAANFALLAEIIYYAGGCAEYKDGLAELATSCLREVAGDKSDVFPALWKRIRESKALESAAVDALVGQEKFEFISASDVGALPEANCAAILQMQDRYIRSRRDVNWTQTITRPSPAVAAIIQRSVQAPNLRSLLMDCIKGEPKAMEIYIIGGATLVGSEAGQRASWWNVMLQQGHTVEQLARILRSSDRFDDRDIEQLLISALRSEGFTEAVCRVYEGELADAQECGKGFFTEALEFVLSRGEVSMGALERLWSAASKGVNAQERMRQMITSIDQRINYVPNPRNRTLAEFVSSHTKMLGRYRGQTYLFLEKMTQKSAGPGLRRQKQTLLELWQNANEYFTCQYTDKELSTTPMGEALLQLARDRAYEMASILLILGGIRFAEGKHREAWLRAYTRLLVNDGFTVRDNPLAAICALRALLDNRAALNRSEISQALNAVAKQMGGMERVSANLDAIINDCVKAISNDKRTVTNAAKLTQACREDYGEPAAKRLSDALDHALAIYQSSAKHSGDNPFKRVIGSLFGRK